MSNLRLTDITLAESTAITPTTLIHVVTTADTSQYSGGSSYAGTLGQVYDGLSGYCVPDLYVSNVHSCSPLNINPLDEGNVYFGSTSAVTIDLSNNRVGIGTSTPTAKLEIVGVGSTNATDSLKIKNSSSIENFGVRDDGFTIMRSLSGYGGNILVNGTSLNGNSATLNNFSLSGCTVQDYLNFNLGAGAYLQNASRITIGGSVINSSTDGGGITSYFSGYKFGGNSVRPLNRYFLPASDEYFFGLTPVANGMSGNKFTFFNSNEVIQFYGTTGWTNMPSGTTSTTGFSADWTQTISASPTQSEVESLRDQIIVLQKHLAALIRLFGRDLKPATADSTTDTITINNHGFLGRQSLKIVSGTPPNPLTLNTTYFVTDGSPTTNTFQVSTAVGNPAVDLTTNGTDIVIEATNSGMNILRE